MVIKEIILNYKYCLIQKNEQKMSFWYHLKYLPDKYSDIGMVVVQYINTYIF